MSNLTFSKVIKEHFPTLATYTPVLAKVHGNNHPELAQVRDIFAKMNTKVQKSGSDQVDLSAEFNELRKITSNYAVPSDGCETYVATYQMLESADKAYHS
ncbi:iron-sulfur cluster repair di-iron protein, ric [Dehalobacterium formicoaceticum]|uniref:Iron-sulfur cluster repair di-iron protein, ric n=1 Tax=Dehalobacterium formicoaceticum TaxID=51515 RepID=A0ABT1Y7B0_9FIRM|nr:iron-sulfur cluster repair di-iron protein, ric [Dehalobacterium formicoaceticum]MCR6546361.1 iron-sulfur cluster repair di-iron protein, ric [Dehalobacterium formicoaceticum]